MAAQKALFTVIPSLGQYLTMKIVLWALPFAVIWTALARPEPWGNVGMWGYSMGEEEDRDWGPIDYTSYTTSRLLKLSVYRFLDSTGRYVPVHPNHADHPCSPSRFKNLERLGLGGQSNVYLARDRVTRDHVAVKSFTHAVTRDSPTGYIDSIRTEELFLGRLDHPSIPKLYCTFVGKDGHVSLVMQRIQGKDLSQKLFDDMRMTFDRVQTILRQLVNVLEYLHSQKIIHRDVKLENVVMEDSGSIHLIDFDHAVYTKRPLLGQAGTLCNMPPEMVRELPYDDGTDWYGVGLILFQLFTGYHPFQVGPQEEFQDELDLILKGFPKLKYEDHLITSKGGEDISESHAIGVEVGLADDLIGHLCNPSTTERWTYGNGGLDLIKSHPFFQYHDETI